FIGTPATLLHFDDSEHTCCAGSGLFTHSARCLQTKSASICLQDRFASMRGEMSEKDPVKSAAAIARAASLTSKQRREIARKAAEARWTVDLPKADFEGDFFVGDKQLASAVLEDETRVITQATFLKALNRSRSPKAGTGVLSTINELPFFLKAEALQPF